MAFLLGSSCFVPGTLSILQVDALKDPFQLLPFC